MQRPQFNIIKKAELKEPKSRKKHKNARFHRKTDKQLKKAIASETIPEQSIIL